MNNKAFLDICGIRKNDETIHFPTLTICPICGGYVGFSLGMDRGHIKNKEYAYQIALAQYGYRLCDWGANVVNREHVPKKCSCHCNHIWERKEKGFVCTKCKKGIRGAKNG